MTNFDPDADGHPVATKLLRTRRNGIFDMYEADRRGVDAARSNGTELMERGRATGD